MELTDYKKQHELALIEQRLTPLVKRKDRSWIEVYRLLDIVEEEELYSVSYKSYTAWLTDFASRANVTVSLLWKKKKAGRFYSSYMEERQYRNEPYIPMEELTMDPEVIVMIEKITAGNLSEAHKMIGRSLNGEMKRSDLKTLWESEKKERALKGLPVQRANGYDKDYFAELAYAGYSSKNATNIDILTSLCNEKWLCGFYGQAENGKYRLMTEFSVISDKTETDYVVVENCIPERRETFFHLHSIKIICEKEELEREIELKAFPEYMDYYWLAVPLEYSEYAYEFIEAHENIGLILYDENTHTAMIDTPAVCADGYGTKRTETINSVVYYLL